MKRPSLLVCTCQGRSSWLVALGAVLAIALAGCSTTPADPPTDVVAELTLGPRDITLIAGASAEYRVNARDARGNPIGSPTLAWEARDPLIASVSASGVVIAHMPETTVITVTADGAAASTGVIVVAEIGRLGILTVEGYFPGVVTPEGRRVVLAPAHMELTFAPDAKRIVLSLDDRIQILRLDGTIEFEHLVSPMGHYSWLSADGESLLYTAKAGLELVEVQTGIVRTITDHRPTPGPGGDREARLR